MRSCSAATSGDCCASSAAPGHLPAEVAELVAEELRYDQTAWHGPLRLAVLWRLADRFLVGQDAEHYEQMLFDQLPDPGPATVMGAPWTFGRWLYEAHTDLAGVINEVDDLALDHNIDTARGFPDPDEDDGESGDGPLDDDPRRAFGHLLDAPRDDSDDVPRASQSNEGRGGATVWRARRQVALGDLARWLVEIHRAVSDPVASDQRRRSTIGGAGPERARRLVTPPGWTVALPARWTGLVVLAGRESPEQRTWLRERRILGIEVGPRRLLWPLVPVSDGRACALEPVPGMEVVLCRLGGWSPGEVAEFVLASIPDRGFLDPDDSPEDADAGDSGDDGDEGDRESGLRRQVATPAYVAHRHGLIDETTLRALVADAAHHSQTDMAAAVRALDPEVRAQLSSALPPARSSTADFNRLLAEWGHHGIVETRPTWSWPVASIADALEQGVLLDAVAWLVDHDRFRRRSTLERSMQDAWAAALLGYRVSRRPSP